MQTKYVHTFIHNQKTYPNKSNVNWRASFQTDLIKITQINDECLVAEESINNLDHRQRYITSMITLMQN